MRYDVSRPVGLLNQYGGSLDDPFYRGFRFQRGTAHLQRGRGVLGVLGKMGRFLMPIVRKALPMAKQHLAPVAREALKAIAEEGVEAAKKGLKGIVEGRDAKDVLVTEGTQALENLARRGINRLRQSGSGRRRKRITGKRKKTTMAGLHLIGKSVLESKAKRGRRKKAMGLF